MKYLINIFLLYFLAGCNFLNAQQIFFQGEVKVQVQDKKTNTQLFIPVKNAQIFILNHDEKTILAQGKTDEKGIFSLDFIIKKNDLKTELHDDLSFFTNSQEDSELNINDHLSIQVELPTSYQNYILRDSISLNKFYFKKYNYLPLQFVTKSFLDDEFNKLQKSIYKNKLEFNSNEIKILQDSLAILSQNSNPNNEKLKQIYSKISFIYDENTKISDYINYIAKIMVNVNTAQLDSINYQFFQQFISGNWNLLLSEINLPVIQKKYLSTLQKYDSLLNKLNNSNKSFKQIKEVSFKLKNIKFLLENIFRLNVITNRFDDAHDIFSFCLNADSNNINLMLEYLDLEEKLNIFDDQKLSLDIIEKVFLDMARVNPKKMLAAYIRTLYNIGRIYFDNLQYTTAKNYFIRCLKYEKMLNDYSSNIENQIDFGFIYFALGNLEQNRQNFEQAKYWYQQSISARKILVENISKEFLLQLCESIQSLGDVYRSLQYNDSAITCYEDVASILQPYVTDNPESVLPVLGNQYFNLGLVYREINELKLSEKNYKKSIEIRQDYYNNFSQQPPISLAFTYNNLGILYTALKKFDSAYKYLFKGLELVQKMDKNYNDIFLSDIAQINLNIGNLFVAKSEIDSSMKYNNTALELYNKLLIKDTVNNWQKIVIVEKRIIETWIENNQIDSAKSMLQQAILQLQNVTLKIPDYLLLLWEQSNFNIELYNIYYASKNLEFANKYLDLCLADRIKLVQYDSVSFINGLAWVYLQKGLVDHQLHNNQEAVDNTQKAVDIYLTYKPNENLNTLIAQLYGNLGFYYSFIKQFDKAEAASLKGLELDKNQDWIITNLVTALLFQDKYTEAMAIYKKYALLKPQNRDQYFKDIFIEDLNAFENAKVIPQQVLKKAKAIKKYLSKLH